MYATTNPSLLTTPPITEPLNAPLLVATDGLCDSDGAVRVGVALSRRDGTRAELFSVVEPIVHWDEDVVVDEEQNLAG